MRLIVSSDQDEASKNILSRMLEKGDGWEEIDEFQNNPVYKNGNDHMVMVENHHIYCDDLDEEVQDTLNIEFDELVFISRHSSKAGVDSLTVHPIGNYGEAKFGGSDEKLVLCSPYKMTRALLILKDRAEKKELDDEYEISLEATHHGPFLKKPTYYIEIGSDSGAWTDKRAGEVIAETVMSKMVKGKVDKKEPVVVGIGGGHYAPRFSQLALRRKVSIGHMVPDWGLKYLTRESFGELVKKTPDLDHVYFDRSSTSGKERERVRSWAQEYDLSVARADHFEER